MAISAPRRSAPLPSPGAFHALTEEYALSLRAAGRSPKTVDAYRYALTDLEKFLTASPAGDSVPSTASPALDPEHITSLDLQRWLADRRMSKSPANAGFIARCSRPFFVWMTESGYLDRNPFQTVRTPVVPSPVVEVLTDDEVRALLAVTAGSDWRSRRDRAILRVLLDTGLRRGEVVGLVVSDLDLGLGVIHVRGVTSKGGRGRLVPIGLTARKELRVWLRSRGAYLARRGHPDTGTLFVSYRGEAMTGWGLHRMVARRGAQAGVQTSRAVHVFRHSWATRALAANVGELDVMTLGGWSSLAMLGRYTASNRAERAIAGHARWSPGDALT